MFDGNQIRISPDVIKSELVLSKLHFRPTQLDEMLLAARRRALVLPLRFLSSKAPLPGENIT